MPTFEIGLDDGRKVRIDADDQQSALAGAQRFLGHGSQSTPAIPDGTKVPWELDWSQPQKPDAPKVPWEMDWGRAQAPQQPSTAEDVAKSGGIGLVKGLIGVAGLPGSVQSLIGKGFDALGAPPRATEVGQNPTPADITKAVEPATGPLYEPKTTAGQYAQSAGEFAPSVLGGPESLVSRLLTRAVAPGLASEAAGQATQGTAAEPYARILAAVLGGSTAAKALAAKAPSAITSDAIKAAGAKDFDNFRDAPVTLDPQPISDAAQGIKNELDKSGLFPELAPKTNAVIDRLANTTDPITLARLDAHRRALTSLTSAPGEEGAAAAKSLSGVDKLLNGLLPTDAISGGDELPGAIASLRSGQKNWAAAKQLETLEGKSERGELNAATSTPGQSSDGIAQRQQIKSLLLNPDFMRRVTPEQEKLMNNIVRGTPLANIARLSGKLMGGGDDATHWGTPALVALLAPHPVGLGVAAAGVAGRILKKAGDNFVVKQVDALKALSAAQSPLAQSLPKLPPAESPLLTKALAASLAAQQPVPAPKNDVLNRAKAAASVAPLQNNVSPGHAVSLADGLRAKAAILAAARQKR